MELPKYIQDKIRKQNEHVRKAKELQIEIEHWCSLSNIDVWSEEYRKTKGMLSDAVAPIDGNKLLELYKNVNKI